MNTIDSLSIFFFFNDTATTEIYTLSLHDALPIYMSPTLGKTIANVIVKAEYAEVGNEVQVEIRNKKVPAVDRKSTRLNSSHANISYAVFCLKKKKIIKNTTYKINLMNI